MHDAVSSALLHAVAPVLGIAGLLAAWNGSRRHGAAAGLLGGLVVAVATALLTAFGGEPTRAYAAVCGMVLCAALAWAWWSEGLQPINWSPADFALAVAAVILFSIAASGSA